MHIYVFSHTMGIDVDSHGNHFLKIAYFLFICWMTNDKYGKKDK